MCIRLLLVGLLALECGHALGADFEMKEVKPESVGFASDRLQRLDRAMSDLVDRKIVAGTVTALARHGKVIDLKTYGKQDLETGTVMQRDTIFRCASMTKPVTAVAMMILYEEGKWRPEEPLLKYIPEFANLKVLKGIGKDGNPMLEDPLHPPTVGELMSQTAGFTYGFSPNNNPIDKMYAEAKLLQSGSLQEFIGKLSKIPLAYQPGTRWTYSVSVDIQGYLVEKLSGKSLPDFMRERIFEPLGMKDSAFFVPKEKLSRLAGTYRYNPANSSLVLVPRSDSITATPSMPSGGGGLMATAPDYLRFAQMLVNGGELNGARLLAPSSVELMRSNHLSDKLLANGEFGLRTASNDIVSMEDIVKGDAFGIAFYKVRPGIGYGYDVGVIFDPNRAGRTVGKGTFHWDGAFGTWFWVDPTNDLVFVGMIQAGNLGTIPNVQELARTMVYQALTNPEK